MDEEILLKTPRFLETELRLLSRASNKLFHQRLNLQRSRSKIICIWFIGRYKEKLHLKTEELKMGSISKYRQVMLMDDGEGG